MTLPALRKIHAQPGLRDHLRPAGAPVLQLGGDVLIWSGRMEPSGEGQFGVDEKH